MHTSELATEHYIKLLTAALVTLIQEKKETPQKLLFEAARYSLLSGGKRLRPILAFAVAEMYGTPIEKILTPACALEIVHTYSLIHDDLPCMDDDDLRRGMPTLHKVYGEGHAVLTGDFLLTFAFELLAKSPHLTSDEKIELITSLSEAAGAEGMIGGQVVDLLSEGKPINWDTLECMHVGKTSALIISALEFGAIIGNAPLRDRELLRTFGKSIGLAFQIIDDVLDVTSTTEDLGKPAGSDKEKAKPTAVTLLGLEKARTYAEALFEEARKALNELSLPSPLLQQLAKKLVFRTF